MRRETPGIRLKHMAIAMLLAFAAGAFTALAMEAADPVIAAADRVADAVTP